MRRITLLFLSTLVCAFAYAQPVLKLPVNSKTSALANPRPTFKMSKVTGAVGYEIYITSNLADTSNSSLPASSTVGKSKRYRLITLATDSTYTLSDTVLAKGTVYGWKVRSKSSTTFSSWSKYSFFKTPAQFVTVTSPEAGALTTGQHYIYWSNYTGIAVKKVALSLDSGATYQTAVDVNSTALSDSLLFDFQGGTSPTNIGVIRLLTTANADTALSASFTLNFLSVTSPAAGTLFPGPHYVHWYNYTGAAVKKVALSLDGGDNYATAVEINSSAVEDSLLFDFQGDLGLTNDGVIRLLTTDDADTALSAGFTLRFLKVTSPTSGTVSAGQHYVVWNNLTGTAVKKVAFSFNGTTYLPAVDVNTSAIQDSVLFDFAGGRSSSSACVIRLLTASDADTALSSTFTLNSAGAVFSIPRLFGDPGSTVYVPISVVDNVAGDSVRALDVSVTFDTAFVKFKYFTVNASLNNWLVDTASAKLASDASYARVAAFKLPDGAGVKNSEIIGMTFVVNNYQSLIGSSESFVLKNSVLSAAGNDALSLDVSSSTDGLLKVYSSIAGNITYFHEKWDGSVGYPISGDSLIVYYDSTNTANNSVWSVTNGAFRMSSREPDDTVNFYPAATQYTGSPCIDIADARKAFTDWHDTLSTRARIAADVNDDGLVNASDAMAIMEISVDSTYLTKIGKSNWIFIDSTSLASFESASDSLTGWYAKQRHSISFKLHNTRVSQDFWGVLRGDVNFDYAAAPVSALKKSSGVPAVFSTDASVAVRQGEEVWIPLQIAPGESNEIGGFNASMQLDPQVLTYTGQFKFGPTIPQGAHWYVTAKSDAAGTLKIAATDLSSVVTPIAQDGPAILFKYVVNKTAKLGSTSNVNVQVQSVYNKSMQKLSSFATNGTVEVSGLATGIGANTVVRNYALAQNYPNPFNPSTTIEFALPKDSRVVIKVYNILGRELATLFSGYQTSGYHQVTWNAGNMSSGVYFYEMKASSISDGERFQSIKKLTLLK